jgi:hypothetical protein
MPRAGGSHAGRSAPTLAGVGARPIRKLKRSPHLDAVKRGDPAHTGQGAGCVTVLHAVALSIAHWDNVARQKGNRKAAGGSAASS